MMQFAKLVLVASLLCSHGVSAAAGEIIGIWASVARTKGGLGSQWVFGPAGVATYTFGAIVDFHYETKGSELKLTLDSPDGSPPPETSVQEFSIQGDTLTVNPNNAEQRQVMSRMGKAVANRPLVGEWTYKHYTGGPAYMRYSGRGKAQLIVPMKTLNGTYQIENGAARAKLSGGQSSILARVGENGTLTIRDEQGKETTFRRFQY
jgi:hypothetical protein